MKKIHSRGWKKVFVPDGFAETAEILVGIGMQDKNNIDNRLLDVNFESAMLSVPAPSDSPLLAIASKNSKMAMGDVLKYGRTKAIADMNGAQEWVGHLDDWFAMAGFEKEWQKS